MEQIEYKTKFGDSLKGNQRIVKDPKAIIVIVTGMAEHSERYDDFSNFLNANGYSVYCLDHYGQGKNGELGNPCDDYFFKMMEVLNDFISEKKAEIGKEVYMFSHSMGSFVAQAYIEKYSSNISKVVLCGTNGRNPLVKIGLLLAKIMVHKGNRNKKAKFLHNLSVGAYEKVVKNEKSHNAWISYNEDNVKCYDEDPLSGYRCTNGFYLNFLKGLASIQKSKNVDAISNSIKVLITGGEDDPVGNNSKGLSKLFKLYKKHNVNVSLKIYRNMRHEILNETDHQIVYDDLLKFFEEN